MHNSKYQCHIAAWQHAAHTTDQLTSPCCKQEPWKKAYLFTKSTEEFSAKSSGEWTGRQKKKTKQKE